jgi:hypothetical protein
MPTYYTTSTRRPGHTYVVASRGHHNGRRVYETRDPVHYRSSRNYATPQVGYYNTSPRYTTHRSVRHFHFPTLLSVLPFEIVIVDKVALAFFCSHVHYSIEEATGSLTSSAVDQATAVHRTTIRRDTVARATTGTRVAIERTPSKRSPFTITIVYFASYHFYFYCSPSMIPRPAVLDLRSTYIITQKKSHLSMTTIHALTCTLLEATLLHSLKWNDISVSNTVICIICIPHDCLSSRHVTTGNNACVSLRLQPK